MAMIQHTATIDTHMNCGVSLIFSQYMNGITIRNAIQFLPSKGYLEIRVADMNEEFLTVLIINPCYYASQNEMGQRNLDELKK